MKTIAAIAPTVAKHEAEYARGRALQAALAPFASARDVLDALALSSATPQTDREAITLALVREHQRAAHPLWQAVLLVAYEPMLANVRRRAIDKRDLESRIVLAFLEAIAKVSLAHPPSRLALDLKCSTEYGVFGSAAMSRPDLETVPLSAARSEHAPSLEDLVEREDEKRKLTAELTQLFGDEAPLVLDVLLRARTGRDALVALVAERHPDLRPRQREAVYDEWQRLRRRALTHLEARFARIDAA